MLQLTRLHQTFHPGTPSEVRALSGLDLHIAPGAFVIVLGMNGSGKSTLMNAIAGSFIPDEGEVVLDRQEITHWPEHQRAGMIGRVFQNPFSGTAPDLSILENFALASRRGRSRGLEFALSRTLREEVAERVRGLNMKLEERLDTPIGTLSGGQRQALTLLMATWIKPKLLLLDEHTAALDPKTAAQIIEISCERIERDRLTTLMVTHSMEQALELGDRLVMMHRGRIAYDFSREEKTGLSRTDLLRLFDQARACD
ncbi:MAG TPA: ATP-binding cassette domain-containing protein [Chthoniobacteraceae bacterium]|nr:ATP-binding cassette domain-containing protein [Chthoniobacteraceae bacterium]